MTSHSNANSGECQDEGRGHSHSHDHSEMSDVEARVRALESILIAKGFVDPEALDVIVQTYEKDIGPQNGAQVVAKAWTDANFKRWLLDDGSAAIASLGFSGRQGECITVVENTPEIHNVVVCTLCSCYPWPVLGLPPSWYKSEAYRARVVYEPREVLQEFGLDIPNDTGIRVWDSTAEVRYLVLPMRPERTQEWDVDKLATLVTRDAMIGTALASDTGNQGVDQ
ncbi:MAG: nitrile hydratase subunit alpha [Pseudomonadota bacterium]